MRSSSGTLLVAIIKFIASVHVFLFVGSLITSMSALAAMSAAPGINYTGRIMAADGVTPITSSAVSFSVAIYDINKSCLLFTETRTLDLSASSGTFAFDIGDGTGTAVFKGNVTDLNDLFNNSKTFTGLTCAAPHTGFTALSANEPRVLMVSFDAGDGNGAQTLPALKINPVPSALQAYKLNGYGTGDFLRIDSGVDKTANPNSDLSQAQYDEFWRLVKNPSTAYLSSVPALGGDVTGTSTANTVVKIQGTAVSATAPTANQVLTFTGGVWTPTNPAASGVTSVTGAAPIVSSGGATPQISIPAASATVDGYLSSADWTIFNNKLDAASSLDTSKLTGQVAIANGGTGAATKTDGFDALSPLTTKGDLITSDGTDNIRLPAGSDNYVLTADASQTSGLKWSALPGLPSIADKTLLANTSGGAAAPVSTSLTAIIDSALGNTQGSVLYRNGTAWTVLTPGTSGQFLQTSGAGADPVWGSPAAVGDASYAQKGLVQFDTNAATSAVTVTSGVASVVRSTTGANNTIVSLDGSGVGTMRGLALNNTGTVTLSAQTASATYGLKLPAAAPAADQILKSDASGDLSWVTYLGVVTGSADLTDGKIWVGDGSDKAAEVSMSGDATMTNTGAVTIGAGKVDNAKIAAGVDAAKISAGDVSNTEFDYLNGVTSSIQTQLDAMVEKAGDTMSGDLNMGGNKIINLKNVPNVAADPTVTEDQQSLRWDNAAGKWEWFTAAAAGAGITSLNGESGNSQTFGAIDLGTSVTAPEWSSATNVHTLKIPMAADTGVTAGLITKTQYDSFVAKLTSPLTTKGDLLVFDGAANIRLPAGTDNYVLTADTNEASGLKWSALPASLPAQTGNNGKYLTTDGTTASWDAIADATTTSKGIMQVGSGLAVSSGTVSADATTSGQANKLLMLDGTGVGNVKGLDIQTDTGKVTLQTSGAFTNYVLTLPADDGAADQVLKTDGNGLLSWTTPAPLLPSLNDGLMWVGNGTNVATAVNMSGDATMSNTGAVTLATVPISKGGTGATTAADAFLALSPMQNQGDLIVGGATNAARLPIGTNGQVLTVDTGEVLKVKWTTPASSLPTQTGNGGRYLTTDGTSASWATLSIDSTTTGEANKLLRLDGSSVGTMAGVALTNTGTVTLSAQTASATYGLKLPAAAPTDDQILKANSSGDLSWVTYLGAVTGSADLTDGKLWVGNGSNKAAEVNISGDATMDNAGVLTIKAGVDAAKISAGNVSNTEFDFLNGVTSAIQAQLDGKLTSPLTTKGDVLVHNGTTNIRLPAGTDAYVLTADSAQASGLKWAPVPSAPVTSVNGETGAVTLDWGDIGTIADKTVLANTSGSAGAPAATTLTNLIDSALGNTRGSVLYRGAAGWSVLAPGTSGEFLKTQGNGADPVWEAVAAGSTDAWVKNGNSFGSASSIGNIDNVDLGIKTNNADRVTIKAAGNVGVGTASPNDKLEVNGTIRTTASIGNTTKNIDWSKGNTQEVNQGCNATAYTFSNMRDGGVYTLAITGTFTQPCTFGQTSPDTLTSGSGGSFYFLPGNSTPSGSNAVYSFMRIGNKVYVTWNSGFEN